MAGQEDNCRFSQSTPGVCKGLLRLAIVASVAISLLVVFQQSGTLQGPGGADASIVIQGDVNCSGAADTIDSLQVMRSVAGVSSSTECAAESGDVNCDDTMNAADSLRILRYVHDNLQTLGCTPKNLAERLQGATDAADAEALLIAKVYPVIDVGLYTGDGVQVLAGAEVDLETDFYLYTFESELMASHYVERQYYGVDTLTLFLTEAGLDDGGDALTDADVLALLAANVTASRGDESMFAWRFIDELGLARGLDLTDAGLDLETTQLDALQIFLALYDLTSGLAGSEIHSAAITDLPTAALHNWVARNVKAVASPVSPTHWRHGDTSQETRTFTLTVSYSNSPDVAITSGPLEGFAPAQFFVSLEGFPVWWYPEAGLTPDNGVWQNRASSFDTTAEGVARRDFRPALECPPPGQGAIETNTFSVQIKVQPQFKSIFPPHSVIGLISIFAETHIEIARHTGTSALGAADAEAESIASPCAYKGTATATYTQSSGAYGEETLTMTATGLRFKLEAFQFEATTLYVYQLVAGQIAWTTSGFYGAAPNSCTFEGSGGYPAPDPIASEDPFAHPFIHYFDLGEQFPIYRARGETVEEGVLTTHCPPAPGNEDGTSVDPYTPFLDWLNAPDNGDYRVDAQGNLKGTYIEGDSEAESEWQTTWTWDLEPDLCPQAASVTAQDGGTCGGAASFPRAW